MADPYLADRGNVQYDRPNVASIQVGADAHGVSWGAIFAGAAGAAALSLILLILGVGLGLSSVSPWAHAGVTAATFGVSTIIWITFTQLAASGVGGYLAGRLRKKWLHTHSDEVYFRDTAHGFLAWSVATLATAALLAGTIGSIVSGGAQAGAAVAGGAASTAAVATAGAAAGNEGALGWSNSSNTAYAVDSLFRRNMADATNQVPVATHPLAPVSPTPAMPNANAQSMASTVEVGRIFANGLRSEQALSPEDVKYVGQVVAQHAGISQQEAEKRVTDVYGKVQAEAKQAAEKAKEVSDEARKASAYAALWLFVSLLLGAFVASLMATFGGRQRDL